MTPSFSSSDLWRLEPPLGRCRVCGARERQRRCGPERVFGVGQELVRCGVCAVAYLDPAMTPESLAAFYAGPYRALFLSENAKRFDNRFLYAARVRQVADWRARRLADGLPDGGRALEIGSGAGGFLGRLGKRRPDLRLFAIEPDRARRTAALDGAATTFLDDVGAMATAGPFDLIALFHSLEHLADPAGTLAAAAAALSPDGRIAIEVPDALAPWSGWRDVHSAHLSYFTAAGLDLLLRRVGLQPQPQSGPAVPAVLWRVATPAPRQETAPQDAPAADVAAADVAALDHRIAAHPWRPSDGWRGRLKAAVVALAGPAAVGAALRLRNAAALDRALSAAEPDGRFYFMGMPLDPLDLDEAVARARAAMVQRRPLRQSDVNVAKLIAAMDDPVLWSDVAGCDLINIDGMGVLLGARLAGWRPPGRVAGVDLMDRLLAVCAAEGFRPYILGAEPAVLEQAVARLSARHPGLVFAGWRDGYFTPEEEPGVVDAIRRSGADALFVAMPTPAKERLLARWGDALGVSFAMGVGGAVDVAAGLRRRAPVWVQRAGLEWFFRMIQEPRRLGPRYLTTNLRFALLLVGGLLRRRR